MNKIKIKIDVNISFYNEYFIGGGKGTSQIGNYVLKDINGLSYIPGTSLKGKLRYNVTSIYNSIKEHKCNFYNDSQEPCGCIICDMFGEKNNLKGSLYYSNLNRSSENKNELFSVRSGIQVNRYMKVTKDLSFFLTQTAGEAGTANYEGKIQGYLNENTYKEQLVFLYTAFYLTNTIGGNQSRGLGWLSDDKSLHIYVNGKEIDREKLREWSDEIER